MTWVRLTDTAAMHPIVLGVADHPDATDDTVDIVFGYMTRLVTLAAAVGADYVVPFATARTVAGSIERATRLLALAEYSGYGVLRTDERTGRRLFRLVNDPEFIHIKTADELDWERQRKADNANPGICAPVRCRDGDACRYCGNVVRFVGARKGKLAGTYDHRPPGQPGSAETSVVACQECNARRGADPIEVADTYLPLLPPPSEPYYHSSTREWLEGHRSILAQHGLTPPGEAPDQKNLIAGRPVPGAAHAPKPVPPAAPKRQQRPTPTAAADTAPPRPAAPLAWPTSPADPRRSQQVAGVQDPDSPGRVGSGRVGSTPEVPHQESSQTTSESSHPTSPPHPRRRSPRGRRGRGHRKPQQGDS